MSEEMRRGREENKWGTLVSKSLLWATPPPGDANSVDLGGTQALKKILCMIKVNLYLFKLQ